MKKIFIFPRYNQKGPSSRYRIFNYLEYYEKEGYQCEVFPLLGDWYLDTIWNHKSKLGVLHKIVWSYLKRIFIIIFMPKGSIAYVGAELFPFFPFGFELLFNIKGIKYFLEFDDAIFHYYDKSSNKYVRLLYGNKTPKAIKYASLVITGCEYLTSYAKKYNSMVFEIPTSINKLNYIKSSKNSSTSDFIIGWIGSSSQSYNIVNMVPALLSFYKKYNFKLNLIGFDNSLEEHLKGLPYEIIKWSDQTEVNEIQRFTVGIMPLNDTPFNRGKCAFKLVQYMASGVPTISSPLQSNVNINVDSENLFANNSHDWYLALEKLYLNRDKYLAVGHYNRKIAFERYTIQQNKNKYIEIFDLLLGS